MSEIIVTDEYFGGEEGFNSILNDYYENTINDLEEEDRPRARRFIEEGLLLNGRRIGMTEGVEKEKFDVDGELLSQLLDSRLIRAEITHLGRSFEVSHDTLVDPITRSYDKRARLEEEMRLTAEAEARAAELRAVRRRTAIYLSLALIAVVLAVISVFFFLSARDAQKQAQEREKEAIAAREESEENYLKLQNSLVNAARERYNALVAEGKGNMSDREYGAAIVKFNEAIEQVNQVALEFRNSRYVDSIDTGGAQARMLLDSARQIGSKQQEYLAYIDKAEKLRRRGPEYLGEAKEQYLAALETGFDSKTVRERIRILDREIDLAFDRFIEDGKVFARARDHRRALDLYRKARKLKPKDSEVTRLIQQAQNASENNQ